MSRTVGKSRLPTHVGTMFLPINDQVALDCLHVLFCSEPGSTPMTISTWRSKARHVAEAARLRTSFVLASLTRLQQSEVGR